MGIVASRGSTLNARYYVTTLNVDTSNDPQKRKRRHTFVHSRNNQVVGVLVGKAVNVNLFKASDILQHDLVDVRVR